MEVLKKLKIELSYDPAIPLLGIYMKETEILIQNEICTSIFTAALFTIAKTWKPLCSSMDKWIKDISHNMPNYLFIYVYNLYIYNIYIIYIYNIYIYNIYIKFSHEKEANPAICDSMNGP